MGKEWNMIFGGISFSKWEREAYKPTSGGAIGSSILSSGFGFEILTS